MYRHGIYNNTAETETAAQSVGNIAQVVIGTAPVHFLDDPENAVNKPILCRNISDCRAKLGYSEDFEKYTLCQSMYASFLFIKTAPVVFINVLDPARHFTEVSETDYAVSDNSVAVADDVIVSALKITKDGETIGPEKYSCAWADGKLTVNFTEKTEGSVLVAYKKIDTAKVTKEDIIGGWDTSADKRTGAELIKQIFPTLGVLPYIITAPGWSEDDTVGAILAAKAALINGCYKGMAIIDIDSRTAKTRADAIKEKRKRTLDENCIVVYPAVKKNNKIIAYSAVLSAVIMSQAAGTGGITCKSPSNQKIGIEDAVLADGSSVYYDQEDGNELNAEGIVTVISRNGWYTWGNSTAAYPNETDSVKRFIMTRLSFLYIENDFINSNFSQIDRPIDRRLVENIITEENIKLASYAAGGYIAGGKIHYSAGDNPEEEIMNGHFTFNTQLSANIPAEVIENNFSFDIDALKSAVSGGEE